MTTPPDLAALAGKRRSVLVVDGSTAPGCTAVELAFADAPRVTHDPGAGTGLPHREGEASLLDPPQGGLDLLVVVDVLDRVLDGAYALSAGIRLLPPNGRLLLVQQLSPDGADERAAWNALARLRDARHTWSPSTRELRAMLPALAARVQREVEWSAAIDPAITARADAEGLLEKYLAALASPRGARGPGPLTGEGLAVRRVAILLRPGR